MDTKKIDDIKRCLWTNSTLIILISFGLLLRIGFSTYFPNFFWHDEIFQTIEQGHRIAFGYGVIPWEFEYGIRSYIIPYILAFIIKTTAWISAGSTGYMFGIFLALSALSASNIVIAYKWGYKIGGSRAAFLCGFIITVWFELVYFGPKALTEVIASHLLLPGLYLCSQYKESESQRRLITGGILLGSAIALRMHIAPAILISLAYLCKKDFKGRWLPVGPGILLPILLSGLIDAITLSYPFQSYWGNFNINLLQNKSSEWGISPWWDYLHMVAKSWSWFYIPIFILIFVGHKKAPILLITALAIIATHSLIGHKEYRFIFPALPLLILLAGMGTSIAVDAVKKHVKSKLLFRFVPAAACLIWALTSSLLITRFDMYSEKVRGIFDLGIQKSIIYVLSNRLKATKEMSAVKDVCGVGFIKNSFYVYGGYTYLHHNVPVYEISDADNLSDLTQNLNYLVSESYLETNNTKFFKFSCHDNICIYKRHGSCEPARGKIKPLKRNL